jgi:hypothetical protein
VTLDGERLTESEVARLLAGTDGLALIRGQWVTVDRAKLGRMLDEFRQVERAAAAEGLSFVEAMRMLAGADVVGDSEAGGAEADWSRVVADPWLAETLKGLRSPEGLAFLEPGASPPATLPRNSRRSNGSCNGRLRRWTRGTRADGNSTRMASQPSSICARGRMPSGFASTRSATGMAARRGSWPTPS